MLYLNSSIPQPYTSDINMHPDVEPCRIASLIVFISFRLLGLSSTSRSSNISPPRQISSILAHYKPSFISTSFSDLLRSQSRIRIEPLHRRLLLPSSYRYLRTTKPWPRLSAPYQPPSNC